MADVEASLQLCSCAEQFLERAVADELIEAAVSWAVEHVRGGVADGGPAAGRERGEQSVVEVLGDLLAPAE